MDKVITVKNCGECPLNIMDNGIGFRYCHHPDSDNEIIQYSYNYLDTCPLKTTTLTIKLEQDEQSRS